MPPTLPNELWLDIARYLSETQLKEMYSVNHVFYHLSMSLRYKEISFKDHMADSAGLTNFPIHKISHNLETSSHVRSLTLKLTPLSLSPPPGSLKSKFMARKLGMMCMKLLSSTYREQKGRLQDLERALSSLRHLKELTIWWTAEGIFSAYLLSKTSLSLVNSAWTAFGSNLRRLTLKGTMENWAKILASPNLLLDKLEHLTLHVLTFSTHTNEGVIVRNVLVPFVVRHSKTLRNFSLNSSRDFSWSPLYIALKEFPSLHSLEIVQYPIFSLQKPVRTNTPLHELLYRHADTLTELKWSLFFFPTLLASDPSQALLEHWSKHVPYDLTIPHLQHLHMDLGISVYTLSNPSFGGMLSYIARHSKTLTSLDFHSTLDLTFTYELLERISSPVLRNINLRLFVLTSNILVTMAKKLPKLNTLGIYYFRVGRERRSETGSLLSIVSAVDAWTPRVDRLSLELQQFEEDMGSVFLTEWPVVTLNVDSQPWRKIDFEKCILKSMPCVEFINGRYRADVLC